MTYIMRAWLGAGVLLSMACAADGPATQGEPPQESQAQLDKRVAPDPCALVRCKAPLTCEVQEGRAVCVPAPTCDPDPSCRTDADCKVSADYCGGCNCVALGPGEVLPKCTIGEVACLVDPCRGLSARCERGSCVVDGAFQ